MRRITRWLLALMLGLMAIASSLAAGTAYAKFLDVGADRAPTGAQAAQPHTIKPHPFFGKGKGPKTTHNGACTPTPCGSGDLAWHGGPVQESPAAYVIFWGSGWSTSSGAGKDIYTYFHDVGHTAFENTVTQYYDSTRVIGNSLSLGGFWIDSSTPPTETSNCSGVPAVDDASIYGEVQHAISVNGWADDANNATYFVYTPSGDAIWDGASACSTLAPNGQFCAYHSYFYGVDMAHSFAYGAMPWPDNDGNPGVSGCPALESPNGNTAGDSEVNLTSHEQVEAMTDPQLNAWYDSATPSAYEIGDKCAWIDNGTTTLHNGDQYWMQPEYSNVTHSCLNHSRTWYFAEGDIGTGFSEYLTLENPSSTTANVVVEYMLDNNAAPVFKTYTVNPNARNTIYVNSVGLAQKNVSLVVTADQPVVAERPMYFAYNMSAGGTVSSGSDVLGATDLATQYTFGYLDTGNAGGTAGKHDTYLTILNPNPSTMSVAVTYYSAAGGSSGTVVNHSVTPNARGTVWVDGEGLPAGVYTAVVSLSLPGLVERPMYLVDGTTGYTGSADVVGTTASGVTNWYFAEGTTNSHPTNGVNNSERYLISNPGASATTATVTFLLPDGTTPSQSVSVPAHGMSVVNVNSVLGANVNNSAVVTATAPIVAERFMSVLYPLAGGSVQAQGATDVIGTPGPATEFQFAEGFTNPAASNPFDEYLTLENPNASSVNVTIRYLPTTGGVVTENETLSAHSRMTIYVNSWVPNQSLSMDVKATSGGTLVAERPMNFDYVATNPGATDVIGFVPPDA